MTQTGSDLRTLLLQSTFHGSRKRYVSYEGWESIKETYQGFMTTIYNRED